MVANLDQNYMSPQEYLEWEERQDIKVVWDVDVLKEEVIRVYRANNPEQPQVYRRGEVAEAEPAVPGWSMAVDNLFIWTV